MHKSAEKLIARHAAAVLADKKPSAMFTAKRGERAMLQHLLAENGVESVVLREVHERVLILAYKPELLKSALYNPVVTGALGKLGYSRPNSLNRTLAHLKHRFEHSQNCPHEIGFFLGYPPPDVIGFMFYGGKNCKYCDLWKVYSSVERAKTLCAEYHTCTALCCRHVEAGGSLTSFKMSS